MGNGGGAGLGLRGANLLGHQHEVVLLRLFLAHCDTFPGRLGEDEGGGVVWEAGPTGT